MSDGMDLSLSPPSDTCIPCTRGTLEVEPHTDSPISGQRRLNFIHNDEIRLFPLAINWARYLISFLDDDTKESGVSFLNEKSKVLQAFRNYLARN